MFPRFWQLTRALAVGVLAFAVPSMVLGQTQHVVGPMDLQRAEQNATQARQQNIDTLQGFLGSAKARESLQKAHMNPVQVEKAIAGLSDQELAQLASRATRVQNEFAAGDLTNHDLLLILIGIAALILIIVAVH